MKYLTRSGGHSGVVAATLLMLGSAAGAAEGPLKEPAHLALAVSPDPVAAGTVARITLRIQPKDGVKINRYPKIKLEIPAQVELVEAASAEMGNDRPPAPDKLDTNYYQNVEPLELEVRLSSDAAPGRHEVDAKVTYFYCVTASGFCAPARVPVKIPVTVR